MTSPARASLALAVLRQGLPLALGMASHATFNLVDLILVGRLGEAAVAGVHAASTINFLPMVLGNGLSIATISLIARHLGAGRLAEAQALSSRSQKWMLLAGGVIGGLGAVLAVPSIDLLGVEGEGRAIGIHYLVVAQLASITMFALMQTTATMRARGEGMVPALLLIGANVLNVALDLVFLFGWDALGIPAFGAPGVAYASALARLVAAAIGYWWISRPDYPLRLRWRDDATAAGGARLGDVAALGVPPAAQMLVRTIAVLALTRIAAELGGQEAVTALGVTTRLDTLVLFAALGFASAGTALVGQQVGAGKPERARAACRWSALFAFAFSVVLVAGFALGARPLVALFVDGASERALAAGELYLTVAALGQPFAAFGIAVTGGVNGSGRFVPPMLIDLVGYLGVLLPAVGITAWLAGPDGLAAVWWAFALGNVAVALGYHLYLERGPWAGAQLTD
ncbi:MAG: MATE family efflux transporter [Planctomycetota bacterium]